MSVPFYRPLSKGDEGLDVLVYRTAMIRAGCLEPTTKLGRTSRYCGVGLAAAFGRAQKKAGLPVTNTMGERLHEWVTKPRKNMPTGYVTAPGAADLRKLVHDRDVAARRSKVVRVAWVGRAHAPALHYSRTASRTSHWGGITKGLYPLTRDCSSFFESCYFEAGEPQPSQFGWRAVGWTGSIAQHGQRVSTPLPGDAVMYGYAPSYSHVAIYVGDGMVISHGSEPGPLLLPWQYRRVAAIFRFID